MRSGTPMRRKTAVAATVSVAEITGSESFVHLSVGGLRWVALIPGVVELLPGDVAPLWIDPARMFGFGADGETAASADAVLEEA